MFNPNLFFRTFITEINIKQNEQGKQSVFVRCRKKNESGSYDFIFFFSPLINYIPSINDEVYMFRPQGITYTTSTTCFAMPLQQDYITINNDFVKIQLNGKTIEITNDKIQIEGDLDVKGQITQNNIKVAKEGDQSTGIGNLGSPVTSTIDTIL